MEEKFLKGRQEREGQRLQRSKEDDDITVLRQQYESEVDNLESEVTQLLASNKVAESQERIDALRRLVQDAAHSIALTAHDMAKANALLARLQQLVDDAQSTTAGTKKFKFSSRLKSKTAPANNDKNVSSSTTTEVRCDALPAAAKTLEVAGAGGRGGSSSSAGFGNSYGPCSHSDLFIAHSKGVFISGCTDCAIYCVPVAGSIFLSNCVNCRVYVACHQLRLKDCRDTDIFVWCASTPIIESCDGMRFGPYTCWEGLLNSAAPNGLHYATHAEWVRQVGEIADTAQTEQNYTAVDDFQWVRKTASPHWRVMAEAEQQRNTTAFGPATPPNSAT